MNEKITQMLGVCEEMTNIANDARITEMFIHAKQQIEAIHTPSMAVIGMGPVGRTLLDAAGKICEAEVPSVLDQAFTDPVCVTLEDNEAEVLYRIGDEGNIRIADAGIKPVEEVGADELLCGFPCDALKNTKMILCGGITEHENWKYLLENIDSLVLRINATAAMNQVERGWIDNELIPLFGRKHVAVWVDLMDQLNTEEDQADVMGMITNVLKKREMDVPVFTDAKEAGEWMRKELAGMNVRERYESRVLRIFLHEMYKRIADIQKIGVLDEQTVSKAIREMESKRNQLELAGEIAADTTVVNTYANLKLEAKAGVRDFNGQAVESICKKIADATTDELDTLEPTIQSYLRKIWERFQQEMNVKLNAETEKCYALLMERMEKDAEKMIADMDEQTQKIFQEAISRPVAEQEGMLVRPDWEYQGTNSLTKLKIETRNMMLLAIPMAFASPVLAVATIFGAKYYRKTQTEKRGADFRYALQEQVKVSCEDIVEDICREIERNFDDAAAKIAASVRGAYNGLADQMIEKLNQLAQQQRELMSRSEALKQMQTVTIPGMMSAL